MIKFGYLIISYINFVSFLEINGNCSTKRTEPNASAMSIIVTILPNILRMIACIS